MNEPHPQLRSFPFFPKMENFDVLLQQNETDWSVVKQRFEVIQQRTKQVISDESKRITLNEEQLAIEREIFRKEKAEFEDARDKVLQAHQAFAHRVQLVVGGKEFDTTHSTIMKVAENPQQDKADANSIIAVMLAKMAPCDTFTKIRIDRDPKFFDVILNYHRERSCADRSMEQWAEDYLTTFTESELNLIRSESEYYKIRSLSNYVTWFLVSRKDPAKMPLKGTVQVLDTSRTRVLGSTTDANTTIEETNFTRFVFNSVEFKHKFEFKGCVFRNAVFNRCRFLSHMVFSDCDLRGLRFNECASPPSQVMIRNRCLGKLP